MNPPFSIRKSYSLTTREAIRQHASNNFMNTKRSDLNLFVFALAPPPDYRLYNGLWKDANGDLMSIDGGSGTGYVVFYPANGRGTQYNITPINGVPTIKSYPTSNQDTQIILDKTGITLLLVGSNIFRVTQ